MHLYQLMIQNKNWWHEWTSYQQLLSWMNEQSLDSSRTDAPSFKDIAHRLHWHENQAKIYRREHRLLPPIRKGDRENAQETWPITVYLDHLRSAHNVGSIIRTIEAFSLGQVVFSEGTPFITHAQVQQTAMGTEKWVECKQGINLHQLPRPFIILETSEEAISLFDFIFPSYFTLVIGNEEFGCSDEALAVADRLIEIPLRGRKNSLNVANAFAIVAAEVNRQRLMDFKG
jgi:tRNA G18 (ribose-2'-O)-methylase SpoU